MKLKISLVVEMLIFYWDPLLQSVYMHLCKQVLIKDTDFVIGFVDGLNEMLCFAKGSF